MGLPEQVCEVCLSWMLGDKLVGWLRCLSCGNMKKEAKSMISMQELLQGHSTVEALDPTLLANAQELLVRLNKFRTIYGIPMVVTSGYRPPEYNTKIGGAKDSAHCFCMACDFKDDDGKLFEFIKQNQNILEDCNLYMEDPRWCPNWIHLQSRIIPSGNRIFCPFPGSSPKDPSREI
jgi:hypothetical protein